MTPSVIALREWASWGPASQSRSQWQANMFCSTKPDYAPLDCARESITKSITKAIARGKLNASSAREVLDRIQFTTHIEDLAQSEGAIEAVTEDVLVKQALFARLDVIMPRRNSSLPTRPRFRSPSWRPRHHTESGSSGFISSRRYR